MPDPRRGVKPAPPVDSGFLRRCHTAALSGPGPLLRVHRRPRLGDGPRRLGGAGGAAAGPRPGAARRGRARRRAAVLRPLVPGPRAGRCGLCVARPQPVAATHALTW